MSASRIDSENQTVQKMIAIYCRDMHKTQGELCPERSELSRYASVRVQKCKFGQDKPVCGKCTVHCYRKDMRDKIIEVMRYAGPRMVYKHPLLAFRHLMDRLRKVPD